MYLNLLKGYPDFIGKRKAFAGYGNGPSSYVHGVGDPLVFPVYDHYIDSVAGTVLSLSGNYYTIAVPSGVGPRQNWNLLWLPTVNTQPNVPLGLGPLSAAATQSTYTSAGLLTVVGANTLVPGQFIVFSNGASGAGIFLNGVMAQVTSATPTTYTVNFGQGLALAYTIATDTLKYQVVQASAGNLLQGQLNPAPITGVLATAILLTVTQANSYSVGQFVALGGTFKTASLYASGAIVEITSASSTGWTAKWQGTIIAQTSSEVATSALLVTNGGAPVQASQSAFGAITNTLAVAAGASAAGLITLTSIQNMQAGNIIAIQNVGVNTTLNGTIATVIASGLTNIVIKANGWTVIENTQAETVGTASVLVTGVEAGAGDVLSGTNLSAEQIQIGGFCGQY
jgi:hypothetical protein